MEQVERRRLDYKDIKIKYYNCYNYYKQYKHYKHYRYRQADYMGIITITNQNRPSHLNGDKMQVHFFCSFLLFLYLTPHLSISKFYSTSPFYFLELANPDIKTRSYK